MRAGELAAVGGAEAVEDAVDAGLLRREADRIRASHPLLGAAARKHARPREQRELHLALAEAVAGEERRARHLALAAQEPDAALADTVAAAADGAAARGAAVEAVELAEQALRLTPAGRPERAERLLALAHQLETAGERRRVTELLTPELAALPAGRPRVHAWLLLANGSAVTTYHERREHFEHALAEAGADPALRAHALASMALSTAAEGVERIGEVEAWAQEALAADAPARVERLALRALGWARSPARPPDRRRLRALHRRVSRRRPADRLPGAGRGPAARLARRAGAGASDPHAVPGPLRRARRVDLVRVDAPEPVRARAARGGLGDRVARCSTNGRSPATRSC